MGTKTLIRLLLALIVIAAAAAVIHFTGGGSVSTVTSTTDKKKVYPDFPLNDVAKVVIQEKDSSLTLAKGETSWEVSERDGYAANAEPLILLLRKVWDVNIVQPITIGPSQCGRLGLITPDEAATPEEAATLLTFQNKEGKDLGALWLGKVYERSEGRPDPFGGGMATSEAGRYVKRGDSNAVYLVSETFSEVETDPTAWIDKTFFKVEKIKSIEIVTKEKDGDWKLERSTESEDFTLANIADGEELDQAKVSSMKSAFSNAQFEDVFIGEAKDANPTDTTSFTIVTFDDFTYEIALGEKNDLNELPLTLKVSAKFPDKRKEGEEESAEEKTRLDKEFEDRVAALRKKLEQEQQLQGHVFKVRSFMVDSITKQRSELMSEKAEPATEAEVAPGITLPGLPTQTTPAPAESAAKPESAPAPAPAEPKSAPAAPKPETKPETAPAPSEPESAPPAAPKPEAKLDTAPAPTESEPTPEEAPAPAN